MRQSPVSTFLGNSGTIALLVLKLDLFASDHAAESVGGFLTFASRTP